MDFGSMWSSVANMAREDVNSLISRQWSRSDNQRAREDAERAFERSAALQREFAQHGIRWRVEDAQAAGVHPLFAIGGSGAAASPSFAVMQGATPEMRSGQNLSRAVQAQETGFQKELQYLQLEHLRAQVKGEHIRNMAAENELARRRQADLVSQGFPSSSSSEGGLPGSPDPGAFSDFVKFKQPEVTRRSWLSPEYVGGPGQPGWELREVDPGKFLTVFPQEGISEMFENPITGLWALNKTLQRDPEFFKGSSFPFGNLFYTISDLIWHIANQPRANARRWEREDMAREVEKFRKRAPAPYRHGR